MIGVGISPFLNYNSGASLANGSLLFDAGTKYLVSEDASLLNNEIKGTTQKFSISIWVKLNWFNQTYQTIFSRDNNTGGRQFACEWDDSNRMTFFMADSAAKYSWWKTTEVPILTNSWYNFVYTFDNTQALANKGKIYINGVESVTTRVDVGGGVSNVNDQPTEPIYINVTNFGGLINPVSGYLNKISFYNGVLSAADVTTLYNNSVAPDERNLSLSVPCYMLWNFANSTFSANIETDDIIGTSYGVSKKFISSGMTAADFSASTYPVPLTYNSASTTLFNAFVTAPSTARKALIDDFIAGCVTDGYWDEFDAALFLAGHNQADSKINWKNPGTYNATEQGTLTFTTDEGFTGDGLTGYIDTGVNDSTATKHVLNSASAGVYLRLNVNAAQAVMGNLSGSDACINVPRNGGTFAGRVHAAVNTTVANLSSYRLHSVVRTAANAQALWKHVTQVATSATASTSTINNNIYVLAYNNGGAAALFSTNQAAFYFVGSGSIDMAKLGQRVHNYMIGLGKGVTI